jgi:hypothetical protein
VDQVAGLVRVEADQVDVAWAPEEGQVSDRMGQFEGDGGPGADGEVEFTVGAVVGGAQLPSYGGDLVKGYA